MKCREKLIVNVKHRKWKNSSKHLLNVFSSIPNLLARRCAKFVFHLRIPKYMCKISRDAQNTYIHLALKNASRHRRKEIKNTRERNERCLVELLHEEKTFPGRLKFSKRAKVLEMHRCMYHLCLEAKWHTYILYIYFQNTICINVQK